MRRRGFVKRVKSFVSFFRILISDAARVVQLAAHPFHNIRVASWNPARVNFSFLLLAREIYAHIVNTAVRAVVRSHGKAAPLGVLCLRVGI